MNAAAKTPVVVCGFRLIQLVAHILSGVVRAGFILPWLGPRKRAEQVRRWSKRLLDVLNVRLVAAGAVPGMSARSMLLVANHTSWLDICVLNAVCPGRAVAKSDVRGWPIFGWLAARAGSLFIQRWRMQDVGRVRSAMAKALRRGERGILFPEGTTTDGTSMAPFRTGLIQAAVDSRAAVVPVAIRYRRHDGQPDSPAVFIGDMTFVESLMRVLRCPVFTVEAVFAQPLPSEERSRRELAALARASIEEMLSQPPVWRPAFQPDGQLSLFPSWETETAI